MPACKSFVPLPFAASSGSFRPSPLTCRYFRVILPDWVIIDVPISMWLAGLAWPRVAAGFAWLLTLHPGSS
jgi:hypothetical protein